jgi:hypothetical protein
LARPESAVGWCWSAARRPEASRVHKIDALYGGSPISGADSLAICSQNRFWYPKLPPPASSARMGVRKRILHPGRPKIACYGLTRRQKTPKHPKTLINHSVRNGFWTPQVAAQRSNAAPRPIWAAPTVGAPSGACGRARYAVAPPPPWHSGPDCGAFWPRASFLPLKSGAQSNQTLVCIDRFDRSVSP